MPLTCTFKQTVMARVAHDSAYRKALLREAMDSFLAGDVQAGKSILRDYINATVGFPKLARDLHRSPKSLMRMLGPSGNPHAKNLFEMVAYLQQRERVRFRVQTTSALAA